MVGWRKWSGTWTWRPGARTSATSLTHCRCPFTYWGIGGIDREAYQRAAEAGRISEDIASNHNPRFAPVIQPTLDTGTQALVAAAMAWLS